MERSPKFLGNLFEYFLLRRRAKGEEAALTILGATSGDTGVHVGQVKKQCGEED